MAYNDDAVLAKLSALAETQDSIVTVAQWIMFHRRHADRTVQLWLQRLKDSTSHKRLNLIYLANEVTQQSKARRKEDFLVAFSPVIAEATSIAYKGAPSDVQNRIRRVVDVWRERAVFEEPIQVAVESRLTELDKARGAPSKSSFSGGSIFTASSSSVPPELSPIVAPLQNVSKLAGPAKTAVNSASQDYGKLTDPTNPVPSAPVYAARLNGLLKTLANAEGAVDQCVKARKELVEELQNLLDANKAALATEEEQFDEVKQRKSEIDEKKRDVEMAIMRGLSNDDASVAGNGATTSHIEEPDAPEIEALTPPADELEEPEPQALAVEEAEPPQYQSMPSSGNGTKRRRLDDGDDFPDLGGDDGIDADVAEMLKNDSA